ncbi:kinase family protein [Corchorus capsularis]|uniref:Kinase family protein n=1 Tax=Corchorus capsularis TaxID=210143 RepID=A0A1R3HIM1_COCAP|nr:kinase family protein [Corchorus capsularis]
MAQLLLYTKRYMFLPTTLLPLAVKVLDLDRCNDGNLDKIRRETQSWSSSKRRLPDDDDDDIMKSRF